MKLQWKQEEKNTVLHQKDEVAWLSFKSLDAEEWLMNAFSTRLGGVSCGDLSAMNLGFDRGDAKENVLENFRRFSKAADFSFADTVFSDQTHTVNVVRVTKKDCGRRRTQDETWQDLDGLMTDERGVALCTSYADCVPLYFADPVHRAIALSHSGWRGTAHRMGEVTVRKMQEEFGTDPRDLVCVIGPSICGDCYEVSEDVALQFDADCLRARGNGKYLLDLWEANRKVLKEAGVPEEKITMPELCTCCNPDFLFSHRASHGKRGNLCAVMEIRE